MAIATSEQRAAGLAVPPGRRSLFRRIAEHWTDYLYIAPALGVMLLVIAYPVYFTVYLSFFNTPPSLALSDKIFSGLDNYGVVLSNDSFHTTSWNTFYWTVFSTFFSFVLGLGAALALNREFVGRGVIRGLLLIPYVISAVAASYVWRWIYHSDYGVIGAIAMELHLTSRPINFLDNTHSVLAALIVVNVWKEFSFAMIMLLAGLQTVPDQLHRAAMVDGAGPWDRFWHVTMPHLKGVTLITVLLMVVANLNSFTIPWVMTGGGPAGASDIWITQVYQIAFGRIRFGTASAYSVILFIIMMVLGYFYVRALTGKEADGRQGLLSRLTERALDAIGTVLGDLSARLPRRPAPSRMAAGAPGSVHVDIWPIIGRVFLIVLVLFAVLPMAYMVITSIKTQFAALQFPPEWWPKNPTLSQYTTLLDPQGSIGREFLRYMWNSILVCTVTTILGVLVAVPAAYAFSRFEFPGRQWLFYSVLLRNMFPAVVFLMPLFVLMRWLHLVNTEWSLILTYLTFGLPLSIWLLKGFYDNIPYQLEQAARIDGATRFQAFLLVVMPLSSPGIIATAIYSFIIAWNEYVYALTFLNDNSKLTLPVGLQHFFTEYTTNWPGLMAASFIMSVPVVVMFLILQKYFVRALTEGAVKS